MRVLYAVMGEQGEERGMEQWVRLARVLAAGLREVAELLGGPEPRIRRLISGWVLTIHGERELYPPQESQQMVPVERFGRFGPLPLADPGMAEFRSPAADVAAAQLQPLAEWERELLELDQEAGEQPAVDAGQMSTRVYVASVVLFAVLMFLAGMLVSAVIR